MGIYVVVEEPTARWHIGGSGSIFHVTCGAQAGLATQFQGSFIFVMRYLHGLYGGPELVSDRCSLAFACLLGWLVGWYCLVCRKRAAAAASRLRPNCEKIFGSEFIFEPTRASLRHNVSQPCDAAYMLAGLPAYLLACLLACLFTAAPVTRQSITAIKLCESTLVLASGERQNFPLVPTLIPASTHCRRYLVTKDWSAVWTFDVVLFYLLPPTIYELSLHPERLSSPSIQTVQQSPAKMREVLYIWLSSTFQLLRNLQASKPVFSLRLAGWLAGWLKKKKKLWCLFNPCRALALYQQKHNSQLEHKRAKSPGCSQGRGPILTDDRITYVLAGGHRPRPTRGFTDRPRRPRPVRAERTFEPYLSNMQLF
ncbi:hypothetical protein T02_3385 [Trichinella nativa]|uniref:Uncharacterized protein n=1 Tax=Trichinella nativa TaxID=6335 RepID=A0A0V1LJG0_9BILA|nr:hypothetical protein T02_3385 [Trichinella nativa]